MKAVSSVVWEFWSIPGSWLFFPLVGIPRSTCTFSCELSYFTPLGIL